MIEIADNPFETSSETLLQGINEHKALIFKNVIKPDVINKFKAEFLKISNKINDSPSDFVQKTPISFYRKFNIGSYGKFGEYPRFFRTTYLPFWLSGLNFSESLFKPIILLRNHLAGVSPEFAYSEDHNLNLWSACRVQQYFAGGGFFSEHTDVVIDEISQGSHVKTIQLIALLTSKGSDFSRGGATIRDSHNNLVDLETHAKAGDIIAYDGSSKHGVSPIDPHKVLDLGFDTGRTVALASIYKIIQK